jgi:hypothetical protein
MNKVMKLKICFFIISLKAGETKDVCLGTNKPEEKDGAVDFVETEVKLTENCGGGCCIFEFAKKAE